MVSWMVPPAPDVPCPGGPARRTAIGAARNDLAFCTASKPGAGESEKRKDGGGQEPEVDRLLACFVVVRQGMGRDGDVAAHGA